MLVGLMIDPTEPNRLYPFLEPRVDELLKLCSGVFFNLGIVCSFTLRTALLCLYCINKKHFVLYRIYLIHERFVVSLALMPSLFVQSASRNLVVNVLVIAQTPLVMTVITGPCDRRNTINVLWS